MVKKCQLLGGKGSDLPQPKVPPAVLRPVSGSDCGGVGGTGEKKQVQTGDTTFVNSGGCAMPIWSGGK
jgi:hypothetical protein